MIYEGMMNRTEQNRAGIGHDADVRPSYEDIIVPIVDLPRNKNGFNTINISQDYRLYRIYGITTKLLHPFQKARTRISLYYMLNVYSNVEIVLHILNRSRRF